MMTMPVSVTFEPTPRDYARALRAFYMSVPLYRRGAVFFGLFGFFMLMLVLAMAVSGGLQPELLPALLFGLLFPALFVTVVFLTPWLAARSAARDEKLRARTTYVFAEDGMSCETPFSQSRFDWQLLGQAIETRDDFLLVYAQNKRMVQFVPKRALEPAEADALRELLRRHLPRVDDRRRGAPLWQKIALALFLVAVTLFSVATAVGGLVARGR